MGFHIGTIIILFMIAGGGMLLTRVWRQEQAERSRDRARLRLIEGQLATLRAALRIQVAEHTARQRLRTEVRNLDHADTGGPWDV